LSLPITALRPLKAETKPILMLSAASAGCASTRTVAPASQNAVFIFTPLLIIETNPFSRVASRAPFSGSLYEVTCFVREISNRQQARTEGSLLNLCPIPRGLHHNSHMARKARIIVPVGGVRIVAAAAGKWGLPAPSQRPHRARGERRIRAPA